jgi:hypothetical protein
MFLGSGAGSEQKEKANVVRTEKKMCFIYWSEYLCRLSGKRTVFVEEFKRVQISAERA